jgi:hypothetical protein
VAVFILAAGTLGHRAVAGGIPTVWSALVVVFLCVLVSPSWVQVPAEEYADRLLGAATALAKEKH